MKTEYYIQRTDISFVVVSANSPEEALKKATEHPDWWDIETGEPEVNISLTRVRNLSSPKDQ